MLDHEYRTMREVESTYWWYRTLHRGVVATLQRHLPASARILDAGCGTGGTLARLREAAPTWELHGFDLSPLAVAAARERGFSQCQVASIHEIPHSGDSFDAVVSLDVLCCGGVDPSLALAEIARVLKPGALLILNLPAFPWLRGQHDAAVNAARRFAKSDVRQLFDHNSWRILKLHAWNAWMTPAVFLWRQWSRRRLKKIAATEAKSDLALLPGWINVTLTTLGRLDFGICSSLGIPFGTSFFTVAQRKPVTP